jgi:hypothetical protein
LSTAARIFSRSSLAYFRRFRGSAASVAIYVLDYVQADTKSVYDFLYRPPDQRNEMAKLK